jgi:hypothetical protein
MKSWGVKQPKEICPAWGKVMFDKKDAVTAKNKFWNDEHLELRIYFCPDCAKFHLTKQVDDVWNYNKQND